MSGEPDAFRLTGISYSYLGRHPALVDVDLAVRQGEQVVILGANGKTIAETARTTAM